MSTTPHRVVIVGAGFGGLETTHRLAGDSALGAVPFRIMISLLFKR